MRSTALLRARSRRSPTIVSAPRYAASLLAHRFGRADTATGGAAGPVVPVTSPADSGAGSLRDAVAIGGPKWISIYPAVRSTLTTLSLVPIPSNTTIDARGADLKVEGPGLQYAGSNIIITNLKLAGTATANASSDALDTVPGSGLDLLWAHQCSFFDAQDGLHDITGFGSTTCRVSVTACKFGPHPGPGGVSRTQYPGKSCLCGNRGTTADRAPFGLFTFADCLWEGTEQRNPYLQAATVHVLRCALSKWGDPGGAGYGMECDTDSVTGCELRVEGTVFRPYRPGETHLAYGTVMSRCNTEALIRRSNTDGQRRIYQNNNLFAYGALAGLSVSDGTTTSTGRGGHRVTPTVDFKDTVFTPPYAYSAPTPDLGLVDRLRASAGWQNIPRPLLNIPAGAGVGTA